MFGTKFQFTYLLFAVVMISTVNCMNMREEENEIINDDEMDNHKKFQSDKEVTNTPAAADTTPDATETSPESTTNESTNESDSTAQPPKRDTFMRFIDDLFQVPLRMLKMVSNILSRSLEAFTSKPAQSGN